LHHGTCIADGIFLWLTLKVVPLQFIKFVPGNDAALVKYGALILSFGYHAGKQE
jgi:hypothetical protein